MGRGATCWPLSSLTSGWVTSLAFSLPELMGRWGRQGDCNLTAERIASSNESSGIWPREGFDLIWSQLLSRHWKAVEEHSECRQNDNRKLTQVIPVRNLSDNHQQAGCLNTLKQVIKAFCFLLFYFFLSQLSKVLPQWLQIVDVYTFAQKAIIPISIPGGATNPFGVASGRASRI